MEKNPVILLGISGGIAAYKAVEVASRLKKENFRVYTVMTPSACEFVQPLSFEAVTINPVITTIFPKTHSGIMHETFPHLYPASEAEAMIILPASADILAKIAHGFADDAVCGSALGTSPDCLRFFCPAMNANMWSKEAVQKNVRTLTEQGWIQIGPDSGMQACGTIGTGRMSEPAQIVDILLDHLARKRNRE